MMNLNFTEEQEILRKSARDFLTSKFPKTKVKELEASDMGYSPELWKEMSELGWMGLFIPEKYGGVGMTFLDQALLMEEMGKVCMPGPYFSTMIFGAFPILDFGTEEQKNKYLPEIANGQKILTLALTEPNGRIAANAIDTKAAASGGKWVINGTKLFVPDAHVANQLLCIARTKDGTEPEKGLTIFLVDGAEKSISKTLLKTMANRFCEVTFNNVSVSKESILGQLNDGWGVVKQVLDRVVVAKCCEMIGMAQQVLDMTVQYAKDRKQFDRAIGSFQIIQHYCADMFTLVEGMRLSTYQAAWKLSEGLPCMEEIAIARAWAIEATERILGPAHQIHGAMGSAIEYDLHYYTRYLKASELILRSADLYSETLAQAIP
jgi:alkylation response protein AidB-like acyl-CoA dehydrogenase